MTPGSNYDDEVTSYYRKYMGTVRGYLINMGADHGLADEITDDSFLAARRYWGRIRLLDRPEAYIFKIARNEYRKRYNSGSAREMLHPDPEASQRPDLQDASDDLLDSMELRQKLRHLPLRLCEVIVLRYLAGFTIGQTAELMGISEGAVKKYTSVAIQKLRQLLADGPDGDGDGDADDPR